MSEMVERVAQAIWRANLFLDHPHVTMWQRMAPNYREHYIVQARAAIAAMREPDAALRDTPREKAGDYYADPDVGPAVIPRA